MMKFSKISQSLACIQALTLASFANQENNLFDTDFLTAPQSTEHSILQPALPATEDVIYTETQSGRTFALHSSKSFASLKIPQSEMDLWNTDTSGFNKNTTRQDLSKAIYGFVKDDFDFIFLINNNSSKPSNFGYYGQLISVSSTIQGISKYSNYNSTANYGSTGKLQSVIHLPYLNAIQEGPTLHELAHNWANFFKDFEMANPGGNYPALPHWGWTGIPGQLGGFDPKTLVDLGGGNWQANNGKAGSTSFGGNANGGNSLPYANWELYLMGFVPIDSVSDITYFTNVVTDANLYGQGKFKGTKNTYSVQNFLTDRGPRKPAFGAAQNQFKCLFVVLSASDLSPSDWQSAAKQISWLTQPSADASSLYNFFEATKGQGTLNSDLSNSIKNYSSSTSIQIKINHDNPILDQNHRGFTWNQATPFYWELINSQGQDIQSGNSEHHHTLWENKPAAGQYILVTENKFQKTSTLVHIQ